MILIADSGSTKTTWCLINSTDDQIKTCHTSGINPLYQDESSIASILGKEFTLQAPDQISVRFYGAGCISSSVNNIVKKALQSTFKTENITVETDLTAAARSLCQQKEGIACILGTGSNSCYYNGTEILKNISPLGYMLGDEGSGAVIGRKFMGDLLKNQLPEKIREAFFKTYNYTAPQILEHVYKKPFPNRFLAGFMKFIHGQIHFPEIHALVLNSFMEFFKRNIAQYEQSKNLPAHFTGSVAFHFSVILKEAADYTGFTIGDVTESPMQGLIRYHLGQK